MRAEETITPIPEGGAGISPLGSHAFLDEFALAYHRAVAERLRAEPEAVLQCARRNLNRWTEGDAFGAGEWASLEEWREILGGSDVERLIEIITDTTDEGQRLRRRVLLDAGEPAGLALLEALLRQLDETRLEPQEFTAPCL